MTLSCFPSAKAAGAVTLNLGAFINTIISFIIIAFAVFLVIKDINRMKREKGSDPKLITSPKTFASQNISGIIPGEAISFWSGK